MLAGLWSVAAFSKVYLAIYVSSVVYRVLCLAWRRADQGRSASPLLSFLPIGGPITGMVSLV
jgi:hypothetical protein